MAAATPKKGVHWALNMSSHFGSPLSAASSSSSDAGPPTSSLPYINAQLVAHGYTHQPGISLDGVGKDDAERVVKCLLAMLSQRVDDMSRTEDLSAKIRTLSYDHERLMTMYRTSVEKAVTAEKEMTLHKSRLESANRTLQSTDNAHKHTTAELQRTRTALQAIRSTHQTEIKKLEKEKDRVLERWSKLADAQLTGGSSSRSAPPAGLRCANAEVVEASDVQLRGKGPSLLETALEEAEHARSELLHENQRLKGIVSGVANELERMLYGARCLSSAEPQEEPPIHTSLSLFPFAPPNAASEQLTSLTQAVRQLLNHPTQSQGSSLSASIADAETKELEERQNAREAARLRKVVDNLKQELEDAHAQSKAHAVQVQDLFDRFAEEQKAAIAATLRTRASAMDEESELLEQRAGELEAERIAFTEAAVQLGRERAALEAERLQFLDEKRAWQVQAMLTDFPPPSAPFTAGEAGPSTSMSLADYLPPPESPRPSPPRPPPARKSPRKVKSSTSVLANSGKKSKARAVRRSSTGAAHKAKGKELASATTTTNRVIPSFETEVIPPSTLVVPPTFRTDLPLPPASQLVPPAFVLPPPSPAAKVPALSATLLPPLPRLEFSAPEPSAGPSNAGSSGAHAEPMVVDPLPVASTPKRPFPMAKPLARHMVHAYSPVKPSPLSRILMLGGSSPESPETLRLGTLMEEGESQGSPTPGPKPVLAVPSLAMELGITEDDDDDDNFLREREELPPRPASSLGRYPTAAKDKGKGKGKAPLPAAPAPERKGGRAKQKAKPTAPKVIGGGVTKRTTRSASKAASGAGADAGSGSGGKTVVVGGGAAKAGGPRRVPIGSKEAGSAPMWRG